MPAYFGYWMSATTRDNFEKEIKTLEELGTLFRETFLWRLGENIAWKQGIAHRSDVDYLQLAMERMAREPKALNALMNEPGFVKYSLEDYQIVLSKSIPANRIIRVMSGEQESGRVKRLDRRRPGLRRWE